MGEEKSSHWPNNHYLRQIAPSTISGFKELRKASSTLPPTMDNGMIKISRAIF